MRGLTIVLASDDVVRARSAYTMACAAAALGASVRLFHDLAAVPLLMRDDPDRTRLASAGLPDLTALRTLAAEHGVALSACQTGHGYHATTPATDIAASGMIEVLATLGEDRLVTF